MPRFSWADLRAIVHRAQNDPKSALFQSLYPEDHIWADPATRLMAAMATELSLIKYFTVLPIVGGADNVPAEWLPDRYGPAVEPVAESRVEVEGSVESARAVAEAIRAEMVGA